MSQQKMVHKDRGREGLKDKKNKRQYTPPAIEEEDVFASLFVPSCTAVSGCSTNQGSS